MGDGWPTAKRHSAAQKPGLTAETQRAQRKYGEDLRFNTEDTENAQRTLIKTRATKWNGNAETSTFAGHGMPCPYETSSKQEPDISKLGA